MEVECRRCSKRFDKIRNRVYCYECEPFVPSWRACEWAKKNRERHNLRCQESRKANPRNRMFLGARQRAKDKNIPFNISEEDIVIPETCPVFGVALVPQTPYAPSLDRIEPSLGYVKGNIQVISRKANVMKQDASEEELRKFSEWINQNLTLTTSFQISMNCWQADHFRLTLID